MAETLPWPFFKINHYIEVYLDNTGKWHLNEYAQGDKIDREMSMYCYGNRITRVFT